MNDELFKELGARFERGGFKLFLVGGSVRDMVLDREPKDWDFTTDALPFEIEGILTFENWADAIWDVGREFGTIAARKDGVDIEITTFRFDGPGRKPRVTFTDSLVEDLQRRDFTINAMAMHVDHLGLHRHASDIEDPFGGRAHAAQMILDTPRAPEESFSDDPLRMLRAARFASQLGFQPVTRVQNAMVGLRNRLNDISAERIAAEMDKLLMGVLPEKGLEILRATKLMSFIVPEVNGRKIEWPLLGDDVETRWADLMFDIDPQDVQVRLKALKFSSERIQAVSSLVALRNKFDGVVWFKPEIRKVLAESGPQFLRLVKLLRSSDELLPLATKLLEEEGEIVPFLNGKEVLGILGIKPGPKVGEALAWLWNMRLEMGPLPHEEVVMALLNWDKVTVDA